MRVREQTFTTSELLRVQAEIRRARRAEKMWTVAAVVVLIALGALVYWLAWLCVRDLSAVALPGPGWSRSLAMVPVTDGVIMLALAFCLVVLVLAAVWKMRDDAARADLRTSRITALVDPFADCTDGLDGDEMHRILTSCAAEGREIKRLVQHALTTLDPEDAEDALEVAHDRLTTLVACVEALCERLQPEITEGGREA